MTNTEREQFAILAGQMDKREIFYHALEDVVRKNGGRVPHEYAEDWKTWTQIEHRIPWRSRPGVVKRLRKAARLMAKAIEK